MRVISRFWNSPVLTSWSSLAVRAGGLALLIPLALNRFTTEEVLIWQLLSTLTVIIGWVDFGFGPTFTRIVAFARGGGTLRQLEQASPDASGRPRAACATAEAGDEPLQMGAVLGTQRRVYNWMALGAVLFAATAGSAALIRPMQALENPTEGWIAWGITVASSLLTLLNAYNASIATGFNQIARYRRIETLVGAAQLLAAALAIALGGGLVPFVLVTLATNVVAYAVSHKIARDCYGADQPTWFDRRLLGMVWQSAWRSGVGVIASAGVVQASGMLVAQLASPAAAAGYLVALRIVSVLSQLANVPFYTKLPILSELRAAGDLPAIRATAAHGMRWTAWTFVLGAQGLIWIAPPILMLIDSSVALPATYILVLMTFAQLTERYASTHLQTYTTTNHVVWHIAAGPSGLVTAALYLVLIPLLGVAGAPIANLIGLVISAAYSTSLSLRSIGATRTSFDLPVFGPPVAAMALGSAAAIALL